MPTGKPWEKYQSKPWEKYGAVSPPEAEEAPHGLSLKPVIEPPPYRPMGVPHIVEDVLKPAFPETGRGATIMTGAMTGAAAGQRATAGVPNPLIRAVGPIAGGAVGAFEGAMANSVLRGEPVGEALPKAIDEAKTDAMLGAAGPMLGEAVAGGKRLVKRGALGLDDQAEALAATANRAGVDVGISDVAREGAPARGFRAVLGRFPVVATPFVRSNTQQKKQVAGAIDNLLDTVAPHATLGDAGVDVFKAAKGTFKEAKSVWGALYKRADDLAKVHGDIIDTTGIHQAAKNLLESKKLPKTADGRVKPVLTRRLKKLVDQLGSTVDTGVLDASGNPIVAQNLAKRTSVGELRALQKEINAIGRKLNLENIEVPEFQALRKASEDALTNMDLSRIPQDQAQEIVDAYARANDAFSNGMKVFETPSAKQVGRVDKNAFRAQFEKTGTLNADELIPAIFNAKSPQAMRDLRALVGEEAFKKSARVYLNQVFQRSFKETPTGVTLDPDSLRTALGLNDKSKASVQAFREMVKGTGIDSGAIKDLLRAADLVQDITIPSQFLARQAVFSGFRSLLGGAAVATGLSAAPVKTLTAVALARYTSHFLTSPKKLKQALSILESSEITKQTVTNFLRTINQFDKADVKAREAEGVFLPDDVPSVPNG